MKLNNQTRVILTFACVTLWFINTRIINSLKGLLWSIHLASLVVANIYLLAKSYRWIELAFSPRMCILDVPDGSIVFNTVRLVKTFSWGVLFYVLVCMCSSVLCKNWECAANTFNAPLIMFIVEIYIPYDYIVIPSTKEYQANPVKYTEAHRLLKN